MLSSEFLWICGYCTCQITLVLIISCNLNSPVLHRFLNSEEDSRNSVLAVEIEAGLGDRERGLLWRLRVGVAEGALTCCEFGQLM